MKNTFTVSNEFIENVSPLGTIATKLLFAMMYEIKKQGLRTTYEFSFVHLARSIGIDEANISRDMRAALDKIDGCRWLRDSGNDRGGLIYDMRYDKDGSGTIKDSLLSKRIKEMLFHDHAEGNYTTFDLDEIKKLEGKSKYTIPLYAFIRKKLFNGNIRVTLEDLKHELKAPKSHRFSYIVRDCLNPAQKVINDNCSFNIAFSGVKVNSRKFNAVDFVITKKGSANAICKRTAAHIKWECELRDKNGVNIFILNKVIAKHQLDIEYMVRFWNDTLKKEAAQWPLQSRGKFIKESFDPECDKGLTFLVAIGEYTIDDFEEQPGYKIDKNLIPK